MAILNHGSTIRTADGGQTTTTIVTATNIGSYGVALNSTYYIGTTQNIFNRASGAQTLTGVSIDGNAATATNGLTTGNYAGYSTFSGVVSSASGGFQTATYAAGRNRIWSFGNSDGYGLAYFQGSGGVGGYDVIGMHFGTATAAASQYQFNAIGSFTASGDVRAPIFYDSGNTAYYIDPASTSNLVGLTVANTITGSVSGNAATATNSTQLGGVVAANYANKYATTINNLTTTFQTVCNVVGNGLASCIRASFTGTGNGVVINVVADILVNHFQDILITSLAGFYSILTIRIISDNNENFTLQIKQNTDNVAPIFVEIFPLNSETITFSPSTIYTTNAFNHICQYGTTTSGNGGNNGDIRTAGSFIGALTGNVTGNVSGSSGSCTGNAATVTTNANLTGHITSVGNATSLGSFTSAQLLAALTDETGTGANVFATSPTLVSPILGTPTSGNLANCTFPTLNQNTTGNAGSVTNGVYTTGDQTISGIKYFTSTVDPSTVPAGYAGGYILESTTGFGTYGIIFGSATGQHGAIGYSSNTMYFGTENGTDNTLNTKATLSSGGTFTANGDVRSPIFYDSANTAYYIDPASNSRVSQITTDTGTGIYLGAQNVSTSSRIIINWHSDADYNYLIGKRAGAWTQPMDISFYTGIRYHAHQSYNAHIFYVTGYDSGEAFSIGKGDGHVRVVNNLYAPIIYDSNNTGYYCDPASNSVLNGLYVNAYYNLSNDYKDIYVYGDVNTYYVVLIEGNYQYSFGRYSVTRGYNWTGPDTWYTASHKGGLTLDWEWSGDTAWGGNDKAIRIIEFNESYSTMVAGLGYPVNGGVIIWLRGGGVGGAQYRIRTPIGSNATVTAYDGVSATNHSTLTTFTAADSSVFTTRANTNNVSAEILARYPVRSAASLYNDNNLVVDIGSGTQTKSGIFASAASVRAPIFYDTDNTAYYIDAVNTSNLLGLTVVNTITGNITGNAGTATILQTARNINGTSFNGSAAITTASWGTARTLTIGSTGKSVDGSAAVAWSLAEIGAAAIAQTMFIGTTSVAINRASAGQTLTGISIDGNSGGIYAAGQAFIQTTSSGTSYVQHIQVREAAGGGGLTSEIYAPALGFHWSGVVASNILMESSGRMSIRNNPGTSYENFIANIVYGNSSVQTPILYDSNNTAYYLDPANSGTSLLVAGKVGLGTTSAISMLDVRGAHASGYGIINVVSTDSALIALDSTGARDHGIRLKYNGVDKWLVGMRDTNESYSFSNSSDTRLVTILQGGNVGVGTTSPSGKLHVYNSAAADTYLESGTSGTTGKLIFKTSDNADLNKYIMQESFYMILNGHANEGFKFRDSNGNVLLSIFGAANAYASRVGIGTQTPAQKLHVSGIGYSDTDFRAPTFYDSNNTAYYVDPASTSVMNQINLAGILRRTASAAGYLEGNYPTGVDGNSSSAIYTIGGSYQPAATNLGNMYGCGYTVGNGTANPGLGASGWGFYVASGGTSRIFLDSDVGYGIASNSWRAPVFYDSNNTAYYIDAASTSNLLGLTVTNTITGSITGNAGGTSSNITAYTINQSVGTGNSPTFVTVTGTAINIAGSGASVDPYGTIAVTEPANASNYSYYGLTRQANIGTGFGLTGTNGALGLGANAFWFGSATSTAAGVMGSAYIAFNGSSLVAVGTVDATQFRDRDNTAYYIDAASTSNLLGLTVANTITGSISGNAGTAYGLNVHTGRNNEVNKVVRTDGSGYIQAGWINTDSGDSGFATRLTRITCSTDNYLRYLGLTDFKVSIGESAKNNYSRRVDYSSDPNYHVGSFGHNGYGANETFHGGSGFIDIWAGTNYPSGLTHIHGFNALHYTTNSLGTTGGTAYGWQMVAQYNTDSGPWWRRCSGGSFGSWFKLVSYGNNQSGDIYAQRYYDNDNTVYYTDPASTSNLLGLTVVNTITGSITGNAGGSSASCTGNSATTTLATKATRANGNFYIDDNYGNTVVGAYNAARYQGVYAMGDSYKLAADGTTTGTLYGIAWSHPNAGGAAGNLSDHGALILINGGYVAAISSSIRCTVDMRTPIYYDSNDTTYYTDPASFSLISSMGIGGLTSSSNTQMFDSYVDASSSYQQAPPLIIRKDSSATGAIDQAPVGLFIYNLNGTNNTWTKLSMGSREAAGAGNTVSIAGLAAQKIAGTSGSWATGNLHFWTKSGATQITNMIAYSSGYVESAYSFRAPIFYDSNNTAYYVDPSSTSNLVGLTVTNTITGSITGNAGGSSASCTGNAATVTNGVYTNTNNTYTNGNFFQSNLGTTSGSLSSPPLQAYATGTNAAFMSFHRAANFAVNFGLDSDNVLRIGGWSAAANRLQLDMSGNLTLAGVVDATQFRDRDNTAYYLDPASTSVINVLQFSANSAQIIANTSSSYGSIELRGSRNGWRGILFYDGTNTIHHMYSGDNGGIYYESASKWASYYNNSNNCWGFGTSTTSNAYNIYCPNGVYSGGRVDGTIFYDSNDTGYYLDPNSTSNLLLVKTRNTFGERVAVTAAASTTVNTQYNLTELTMSAFITTLTFSNIQSSGTVHMWTIVTLGNGSATSVTWPAAVKWPGGTAPNITGTNTKRDIYQFITYDGGTNIYAIIVGQNL